MKKIILKEEYEIEGITGGMFYVFINHTGRIAMCLFNLDQSAYTYPVMNFNQLWKNGRAWQSN